MGQKNTKSKKPSTNKLNKIREELKCQLENQRKNGTFFDDLIEDYIQFFLIQHELFEDIKERGTVVTAENGNGIVVSKQNESVLNAMKINSQMLKILSDLGLKEPSIKKDDGEDAYLQ